MTTRKTLSEFIASTKLSDRYACIAICTFSFDDSDRENVRIQSKYNRIAWTISHYSYRSALPRAGAAAAFYPEDFRLPHELRTHVTSSSFSRKPARDTNNILLLFVLFLLLFPPLPTTPLASSAHNCDRNRRPDHRNKTRKNKKQNRIKIETKNKRARKTRSTNTFAHHDLRRCRARAHTHTPFSRGNRWANYLLCAVYGGQWQPCDAMTPTGGGDP